MDEEGTVNAVFRLVQMGQVHPELRKAEASARLALAAAIIELDSSGHGIGPQAQVEVCTARYARTLANLVRGEVEP